MSNVELFNESVEVQPQQEVPEVVEVETTEDKFFDTKTKVIIGAGGGSAIGLLAWFLFKKFRKPREKSEVDKEIEKERVKQEIKEQMDDAVDEIENKAKESRQTVDYFKRLDALEKRMTAEEELSEKRHNEIMAILTKPEGKKEEN